MSDRLIAHAGRAFCLAVAAAGFATLYLAARRLDGSFKFAGLSDDTVRDILHFTGYGSLAVILAKALRDWVLLSWLVSVLLATGEEVHQLFVPFRFGCVSDWLLNVVGITFFLTALHVWRLASARRRGDLPTAAPV